MFNIPQYKNTISLIPGGCPQLLDFEAPDSMLGAIKTAFEEVSARSSSGDIKVRLHAFRKDDEGYYVDEMDRVTQYQENGYELSAAKTITPWLNQWLPIPFLHMREQRWPGTDECRYEYGPSNWARARLIPSPDKPGYLRLVVAFDMQVEEKDPDSYTAITHDDVDANAHFSLAWRFRDNAWFMDLAWVDEWLKEIWVEHQKKTRKRQPEDAPQLEYLASYLVYLETLQTIIGQREVYVIRPNPKSCVDVDLILDIGNSRTTGILVETHTQRATNLNDSYLLQLRDMDSPEHIYTDPFETRVEFSEISFGNDALSLRSGRRTPAFAWPSPVRIGPEASRLATLSRCGKGSTGMSSPKRYLWDEKDWKRTWRFNTKSEKAPYVTRGALAQQINSSGTPLCCMDDKEFKRNRNLRNQERESAFESLFTRSSLMMFLLIEIIQQALLTINSPGQRLRRDLPAEPRRLRQIIFTVPAGMPMAEQKIYRRWAQWAVHVLWEALGWGQYYVGNNIKLARSGNCDYRTSPIVRCNWDEATCSQLVYVYNEISRKFQGDAQLFCELSGRMRSFDGRMAPSVRIAAIDIGGGTTDLSITTFELASDAGSTPRMVAHPVFHDGFNLAGDDILRSIICDHVLAALGHAMSKAGVINVTAALAQLFGPDTMDSSKDTLDQRIQFIRQIAVPVALCLLGLYEKMDMRQGSAKITFRFADCFIPTPEEIAKKDEEDEQKDSERVVLDCDLFPAPGPAALEYVREYVAQNGNTQNFDVLNTPITLDARRINETVAGALKDVLANLCEIINLYDCDALLLTGRPSRWPGVIETIYSNLPLPPSRIIPMAGYRVGGWYPFSDALGILRDPKTTVVVGAILCALAEGQLEGFSFDPKNLNLSSTARYIGEMEHSGQIKKEKVWFTVDPDKQTVSPPQAEITFSGPMAVGFRQLDAERWTTTRYYYLEFVNDAARAANARNLPFRVKLNFIVSEAEDEEKEGAMENEGEFEIEEILDRNGDNPSSNVLEMRLQTLPRDDGFWMDTGIVYED